MLTPYCNLREQGDRAAEHVLLDCEMQGMQPATTKFRLRPRSDLYERLSEHATAVLLSDNS